MYTCANIIDMGQSAVFMTTSDINGMDATEFYNCIPTFGYITNWNSDQLSALYARFNTVLLSLIHNLCGDDVI